jgi:hypothetical protein
MFLIHVRSKLHVASPESSFFTASQPKAKTDFTQWTLDKSCLFFELLLPYGITGGLKETEKCNVTAIPNGMS